MIKILESINLRNSARGNSIQFTVDGKDYRQKTYTLLANDLYEVSGKLQFKDGYQQFIDMVRNAGGTTEATFKDTFIRVAAEHMQEALNAKRIVRDSKQFESAPSAFNAEFIPCKFKPSFVVNQKDVELLDGLIYCDTNDLLYFVENGSAKLIGNPTDLIDTRTEANLTLSNLIYKHQCLKHGVKEWDIWNDMYHIMDDATEEFFRLRNDIERARNNAVNPKECLFKLKWSDKETNLGDILNISNWDTEMEEIIDDIHTFLMKTLLNEVLPGVLFNGDLAKICYETKNELFKRYSIMPSHGAKASISKIISTMFTETAALVIKIPHTESEPFVYHDDPTKFATYHLLSDWRNKLQPNQVDRKDAKILDAFSSWMNKDEKLFAFAWAYSVLHPSLNESIGLLISTGGGTFKSNYFAFMIGHLLSVMYNCNQDVIRYRLNNDEWVKNEQKMESKGGKGVSKAALVFNDECTSASIENFKQMSGSTNEAGIPYNYKVVFQQPVSMTLHNRWLFCTNENIKITDVEGVFTRRLAIIKNVRAHAIAKPYTATEFDKMKYLEANVFYNVAESAYKYVKETFGGLEEAAKKLSISKNLTDAFDEDAKVAAYAELYNDCLPNAMCDRIVMTAPVFKAKIEEYADMFAVNAGGLRKWIENTTKCTNSNMLGEQKKYKGKNTRVYTLYPLTVEPNFETITDDIIDGK
ncbi:MAG: hypothetical protein MJZ37_07015 [Bacilli bacterium]|nr:hypothetical protein [Bacilli bacterium]